MSKNPYLPTHNTPLPVPRFAELALKRLDLGAQVVIFGALPCDEALRQGGLLAQAAGGQEVGVLALPGAAGEVSKLHEALLDERAHDVVGGAM